MKKLLLGTLLLLSIVGFSQTIITSKPLPKEITLESIKVLGDSIKIVKSINYHEIYNTEYSIVNKKDTVNVSLVSLKFDILKNLKKCIDFSTPNKTIIFDGYPFSVFRANTNKLNFITFRYFDSLKNVRYNYVISIDKAESLYSQLIEITK